MPVVVSYVPTQVGFVALGAAIAEAQLRATTLVVVNVAVNSDFATPTFADAKDLDAVEARLTELGISHEIVQITDAADVADAVLSVAERVSASMLVVGLRRRSAVGKLLLGSNAQRIVLEASCPVLTVKIADATRA